jgi:hypothetical protein
MQHENGQISVPEHMVGDPAEDDFNQPIMPVGTHYEAIGTYGVRFEQEPSADAFLPSGEKHGFRVDAVRIE